jgi:tetratricopeptide (TPR) repeat protein
MTHTALPDAALPDIDQALEHHAAGRYAQALHAARRLDEAAPGDAATLRLRCLAAYRLGELDEAAQVALRLLALTARDERALAMRFDVLAVSVMAAADLARFDQAIEHLHLVQQHAARAGTLGEFVRGRATMARCFALLGDPWAAQRLLAELVGQFQGGSGEPGLEAVVRVNHAAVCLQLARMARQGGDALACDEALDHAQASVERTRELSRPAGPQCVASFADVHGVELALLHGHQEGALVLLEGALRDADGAQLWAHARQLRLLEAEVLQCRGDPQGALALLQTVGRELDDGHEIGVRIRYHSQLQRVMAAQGDSAAALDQFDRARALAQYRQYRQARAQSRFLRARLELEHLYRFRAETRGARLTRPAALG